MQNTGIQSGVDEEVRGSEEGAQIGGDVRASASLFEEENGACGNVGGDDNRRQGRISREAG